MESNFVKNTSLIEFSPTNFSKKQISEVQDITISKEGNSIKWYNTYGIGFKEEFHQVILNNEMDDFLVKLLTDIHHPNKVIDLDQLIFMTIRVLKPHNRVLDTEQMVFIISSNFIWSIQEKRGDHFGWIRERLEGNIGLARKKKADYLLFLILESIIDNYQSTFQKLSETPIDSNDSFEIKPTPEFMILIEKRKKDYILMKKAASSLRDAIGKLEKTTSSLKTKYFTELKEQTTHLLSDIDFDIQKLESTINLVFSIQGHRLNEVMKTLTIFSVIFIPLTFLAGIYGMNFTNMPELEMENGYFILLGIMFLVTLWSLFYFYRKKWF